MRRYWFFIVMGLAALLIIAIGGYHLNLAICTKTDGIDLTAGVFLIATGIGFLVIAIAFARMYRLTLRKTEEVAE